MVGCPARAPYGHAEDRTQGIEGAVIEHLRPEVLFDRIRFLTRNAAIANGAAQLVEDGKLAGEQTADMNRIGVDGDLHLVRPLPAESRDDPGIVDPVPCKVSTERLGVAPAILKEHKSRLPTDTVFPFGKVSRCGGGVEGFCADEHEIVGPAGGLVQGGVTIERLRPCIHAAEDAGTGQPMTLQGAYRLRPRDDINAISGTDQAARDSQPHRAPAVYQHTHTILYPATIKSD